MASKQTHASIKRELNALSYLLEGHCSICLSEDVLSTHRVCLECHSKEKTCAVSGNLGLCCCMSESQCCDLRRYDPRPWHPFCIYDDYDCETCGKTAPWLQHALCSKQRGDFLAKMRKVGLHLLDPPPFKSFKK